MARTEFNNVEYCRLLGFGYKYITLFATGREVESWDDVYLKEIIITPHKTKPQNAICYILPINDPELKDIAQGNDTDIFYVERVY